MGSSPFAAVSRGTVEFPPKLDSECEWLVAHDVVSADVVRRNRQVAEAASIRVRVVWLAVGTALTPRPGTFTG